MLIRSIRPVTVAVALLVSMASFAQKQPSISWQKTLGGTGNDLGVSVAYSGDGGYMICGTTYSANGDVSNNHGDADIWIVKLSNTGEFVWEKTYGDGRADNAGHIVPTSDGGFIVGGSTWPMFVPPNDTNFLQWWVFKIDSIGNMLWEKKFGGSAVDNLTWVDIGADGSIYCVGHSSSSNRDFSENKGNFDIWVMKLTSTGDAQWKRSFGGSAEDRAYQVRATADGGCVLAGKTASSDFDMIGNHGGSDGFIAKLSAAGDVEWKVVHGTTAAESFNAVTPLHAGGYVVVGISHGAGDPNGDFDVLRLDAAGKTVWEKFYGGSGRDEATAVLEVNAGVQVLGTSNSVIDSIPTHRGLKDFLVYRLDANGNNGKELFSRWFGGTGDDDAGKNLLYAFSGYITVGTTNSDDSDVSGHRGNLDVWVVKYGGNTAEVPADESALVPLTLHPNPAGDHLVLSIPDISGESVISIDNTLGERIKKFTVRDTFAEQYDIHDLAPGIYVLTLYKDDHVISRQKFVKK